MIREGTAWFTALNAALKMLMMLASASNAALLLFLVKRSSLTGGIGTTTVNTSTTINIMEVDSVRCLAALS